MGRSAQDRSGHQHQQAEGQSKTGSGQLAPKTSLVIHGEVGEERNHGKYEKNNKQKLVDTYSLTCETTEAEDGSDDRNHKNNCLAQRDKKSTKEHQ